MTKHTPGPWLPMITEPGSWTLSDEEGHDLLGFDSPLEMEEQTANAELAAAAPDLLAAAKDAIETLSRLDSKEDAYRVTVLKELRDAVAKAEGR